MRGKGRSGIAMTEVLVAAALVAGACVPLLGLGQRNVAAVRTDRVKVIAETLCSGMVERMGQPQDDVEAYLKPTQDPQVLEATNLWDEYGLLFDSKVRLACAQLAADYDLKFTVRVRVVEPGMKILTCTARWTVQSGGAKRDQEVEHARLIIQG